MSDLLDDIEKVERESGESEREDPVIMGSIAESLKDLTGEVKEITEKSADECVGEAIASTNFFVELIINQVTPRRKHKGRKHAKEVLGAFGSLNRFAGAVMGALMGQPPEVEEQPKRRRIFG